MALTLEQAVTLITAGQAKAREMDRRVTIAVVDPRGDLIAMHRMDGARWTTVQIGRGKAFASVAADESTTLLAERAARPVFQAQMIRHNGELIFAQGGLPIRENGELVGAIGVSGGKTGPEDEEIAAAALSAWHGGP
ncbi:MAG: GlcG/HbpS family heme-binding protein [Chloroflexota bacterium]